MTHPQHITQPASFTDLSAFQRDILTVLAPKAQYGLGVKCELEDLDGTKVNHGRLYPNLDELVEKGLVEKSERDQRTNDYALTDQGEAVLIAYQRWLTEALIEANALSDDHCFSETHAHQNGHGETDE